MRAISDRLHHKCQGFWPHWLVSTWILASSAKASSSNNGNFYTPLQCQDNKQICTSSPPNQVFASRKGQCFTACNKVAECGWVLFVEDTVVRYESDGKSGAEGNCELFTSQPNTTKYTNGSCLTLWQKDQQQNPLNLTGICQEAVKDRVFGPILRYNESLDEGIYALASLNDLLFVTRESRDGIQKGVFVYNATTFQPLPNIPIPGVGSSFFGLTVCPTNNYLYVSESGQAIVYRIDLSSVATNINASTLSWSVNGNNPWGLSVNSERNLLVTCGANEIQEFTPNGTFVRRITFTPQYARHAVERNDGTFAVVYQLMRNIVCLISANDGKIVSCTADGLLNSPWALAVDSNDNILVTDSASNRIVALNPTLSEARVLTLPVYNLEEICFPLSLWLDESRGRLYVGETSNQMRLLVFDNVFNIGSVFTS